MRATTSQQQIRHQIRDPVLVTDTAMSRLACMTMNKTSSDGDVSDSLQRRTERASKAVCPVIELYCVLRGWSYG